MRVFRLCILVLAPAFVGCSQNNQSAPDVAAKTSASEEVSPNKKVSSAQTLDSTTEIQNLIREVLKWADSEEAINVLPVVADKNDSTYIGFDLGRHKKNLEKLLETDMFSKEFVENYNQIVLILDRKLKDNKFEDGPWLVGHLPPFNFASDANPWCLCQDVPYDTPVPWEFVEVESFDIQTYGWKWGKLPEEIHPSWKEFRYKFRVAQENSKWKVSYLEGFAIK